MEIITITVDSENKASISSNVEDERFREIVFSIVTGILESEQEVKEEE